MNNSAFVRFGLTALAMTASFAAPAEGGKLPFGNGDRIAFLGDSITQHGSDSPRGWVNLVERAIRAEVSEVAFVHAGVSGNKSSQMIVRYEGDIVHRKPNWMFFSCGVNDAPNGLTGKSRNRGLPLATYRANVETILDWAKEDGTQVIVLSQTPVLETPVDHVANRNLEAYNEVLKEAALKRGLTYLDPGAAIRAEIAKKADPKVLELTTDGTHLNDRGNAIYAETVLNGLRRVAPAVDRGAERKVFAGQDAGH